MNILNKYKNNINKFIGNSFFFKNRLTYKVNSKFSEF